MFFIFIVTLLTLGFLAASDRIQKMLPATKDLISFLKQSEGWIGIVSVFLALYWLLRILWYIKYFSIYAFIYLLAALTMLILGILYSQTLLRQWSNKNAKATDALNKVVDKTGPLKETLGLVALILGVLILFIRVF